MLFLYNFRWQHFWK